MHYHALQGRVYGVGVEGGGTDFITFKTIFKRAVENVMIKDRGGSTYLGIPTPPPYSVA